MKKTIICTLALISLPLNSTITTFNFLQNYDAALASFKHELNNIEAILRNAEAAIKQEDATEKEEKQKKIETKIKDEMKKWEKIQEAQRKEWEQSWAKWISDTAGSIFSTQKESLDTSESEESNITESEQKFKLPKNIPESDIFTPKELKEQQLKQKSKIKERAQQKKELNERLQKRFLTLGLHLYLYKALQDFLVGKLSGKEREEAEKSAQEFEKFYTTTLSKMPAEARTALAPFIHQTIFNALMVQPVVKEQVKKQKQQPRNPLTTEPIAHTEKELREQARFINPYLQIIASINDPADHPTPQEVMQFFVEKFADFPQHQQLPDFLKKDLIKNMSQKITPQEWNALIGDAQIKTIKERITAINNGDVSQPSARMLRIDAQIEALKEDVALLEHSITDLQKQIEQTKNKQSTIVGIKISSDEKFKLIALQQKLMSDIKSKNEKEMEIQQLTEQRNNNDIELKTLNERKKFLQDRLDTTHIPFFLELTAQLFPPHGTPKKIYDELLRADKNLTPEKVLESIKADPFYIRATFGYHQNKNELIEWFKRAKEHNRPIEAEIAYRIAADDPNFTRNSKRARDTNYVAYFLHMQKTMGDTTLRRFASALTALQVP